MRRAELPALGIVLAILGAAHTAGAQTAGNQPGLGSSALPQIGRVGVPVSGPLTVGVAATGGYGYTEPIFEGDGDHHRATGSLAASIRFAELVSVWLRADGRYDVHPDDALGPDDGLEGLPRLGARVGGAVSELVSLGGELELFAPGGDDASLLAEALTLEARALGAISLREEGLWIALMAGFRLDNTGATVPRPAPHRQGDLIALGVSDSHAVLAGLGVSWRGELLELLGEVSLDALIDADFGLSPIRAEVAARLHLTRELSLELGITALMSGRQAPDPHGALVPIEPRVRAHLGLRVEIAPEGAEELAELAELAEGEGGQEGEDAQGGQDGEGDQGGQPGQDAQGGQDGQVAQAGGAVSGRVLDEGGAPVEGARVILTPEGQAPIEARADAAGVYRLEGAPVGPATLLVEAEAREPVRRAIVVGAEALEVEPVQLEAAVPRGQLRGMIRSYSGDPLSARVYVEDLEAEARSSEDGYFELDVPPGPHIVVIEAPSHRPQRREVDVPENGVTILNADLRRER